MGCVNIRNRLDFLKDEKSIYPILCGNYVFSTMRFSSQTFIFLHEHYKRLECGLKKFWGGSFLEDFKKSFFEMIEIVQKEIDDQSDYIVRIYLSPQYKDISFNSEIDSFNLFFLKKLILKKENRPLKLNLLEKKSSHQDQLIKPNNFRNAIFDLKDQTSNENILYIQDEFVLDSPTSNICFIKDKTIHIPQGDIYQGITVKMFSRFLVEQKNYSIIYEQVSISDLKTFTECYLCNSIMGISPVEFIDNMNFLEKKTTDFSEEFRDWSYRYGR